MELLEREEHLDHLGELLRQAGGGHAVAGAIAVVVYQKVGVEVLRRVWVNLDVIWAGALAIAGAIALGLSLWPSLAG